MSTTTKPKTLMAVAMTAISAIGLLTCPALAQAAPPCSQWGFAGDTSFKQSNGWTMNFNSTGQRAQGRAWAVAYNDDGPATMSGVVDGDINGYAINLQVRWDGGELGKYDGSVDANGFASGHTYDARTQSSAAGWSSHQPLRCLTPR